MKKILIVEDERTTRELLRAMLRRTEYEVVGEAANAPAALAGCQDRQPDLVLLDIELSEGSGLQVLEVLRVRQPEVAVVMISGTASRERVAQARDLGAPVFVAKPFNTAQLLDALERAAPLHQSGPVLVATGARATR
jgi:CheY-like chemotaxis protein